MLVLGGWNPAPRKGQATSFSVLWVFVQAMKTSLQICLTDGIHQEQPWMGTPLQDSGQRVGKLHTPHF